MVEFISSLNAPEEQYLCSKNDTTHIGTPEEFNLFPVDLKEKHYQYVFQLSF